MTKTEHGKTYMLTVKNVTPADLGIYTCKATNEFGEVTTSAFLNVLSGERRVEHREVTLTAPHITRGLRDTEVIRGEDVKLDCRVLCDSEYFVKW